MWMHFSHDLRWFCWRTQIKACLHAKNRHKGTDIVELVYNSQLLQFMGIVSCGILMEDGTPLDLNPLENVWKLLNNAVQHGQICPRNLEELMMTLERE
jgi:hypothetical protein